MKDVFSFGNHHGQKHPDAGNKKEDVHQSGDEAENANDSGSTGKADGAEHFGVTGAGVASGQQPCPYEIDDGRPDEPSQKGGNRSGFDPAPAVYTTVRRAGLALGYAGHGDEKGALESTNAHSLKQMNTEVNPRQCGGVVSMCGSSLVDRNAELRKNTLA